MTKVERIIMKEIEEEVEKKVGEVVEKAVGEAVEKASLENKLELAKNFLDIVTPEVVAEKTGLPLETVLKLKEEN